jgi:hypothetical protein
VDLLAAAGRLSPKGTLRPATYRALFGLSAPAGDAKTTSSLLFCQPYAQAYGHAYVQVDAISSLGPTRLGNALREPNTAIEKLMGAWSRTMLNLAG